VLIAGAGTGKQALQSAFAYGPQARLLATDLSAASLGYAKSAAKRYGVGNVEFVVAISWISTASTGSSTLSSASACCIIWQTLAGWASCSHA